MIRIQNLSLSLCYDQYKSPNRISIQYSLDEYRGKAIAYLY
jgi:hypothetical protein